MKKSVQFTYQGHIITNLCIILKKWNHHFVIFEKHLYTDTKGCITFNHDHQLQLCVDARSPFQDFKIDEIKPKMELRIEKKRASLLMHKIAFCVSFYHAATANSLDDVYVIFQKIMGIETYPIHHYFILSMINQMYLELQEHQHNLPNTWSNKDSN